MKIRWDDEKDRRRMRIRPFNSTRFLVDIAQGDILDEAGDVLLIGRSRGLRSPEYHLDKPEFWKQADALRLRFRQPLQYMRKDLPWRTVYSYAYHPRSRTHLPKGPNDLTSLHYSHLRNEIGIFLLKVLLKDQLRGDVKIGLVPLSWRKPTLTAHAMVEALAGMFSCIRHWSELNSLSVTIRSLDEPQELLQVFEDHYFRDWRHRIGWSPNERQVWFPA